MAGTFAPSAAFRGLAWGIDGVSLVMAGALLTLESLKTKSCCERVKFHAARFASPHHSSIARSSCMNARRSGA
ncbi:MAG: hypothetical protein DMD91_31470 [Candidatus Rokuibacteriota bacterium]|nr:MAG: hypothetical protein DMD91_31470 [Candidatus Rokubacteria bacterium]